MTPTRKEPVYMPLADALALLGAGGEEELVKAHVSGNVTLVGRKASGRGPDISIPRETFAARVRFNSKENSIEPDSRSEPIRGINSKGESWEHCGTTADDFREFEHAVRSSTWGCVKVAAHELHTLKKTLGGGVTSKVNAECDCKRWLIAEVQAGQSNRKTKEGYRTEALAHFQVSRRAFDDRIWPAVAQQHGLSKPGPQKRLKSDNA